MTTSMLFVAALSILVVIIGVDVVDSVRAHRRWKRERSAGARLQASFDKARAECVKILGSYTKEDDQ